jgi:DNA-binding transcriptional ArsR family regulator
MGENVKLFAALSNETRLKIIKSILNKEKCVNQIVKELNKAQSSVSSQLIKLEHLGIIYKVREGKNVKYGLKDNRIKEILKIVGGK